MLIIRKIHIKITVRFYFSEDTIKSKRQRVTCVDRYVEERGNCCRRQAEQPVQKAEWLFPMEWGVQLPPKPETTLLGEREHNSHVESRCGNPSVVTAMFAIAKTQSAINRWVAEEKVAFEQNRVFFYCKKKFWHLQQYGWNYKTLC